MRAARTFLAVLIAFSLCLLAQTSGPTFGGGVGVSTEPDRVNDTSSTQVTTVPFRLYKVPTSRSALANRDLEFLWSDKYRQQDTPLVPPDPSVENDLDRFGRMLCETASNPFGFQLSDIRLVYDYLNVRVPGFRDSLYNPTLTLPGFRVYAQDDPADENNHADLYLWLQGSDPDQYASYPSSFTVNAEDSLTADPATYTRNSLDISGPDTIQVGDTGPNRWTRPDTTQNQAFDHEFAHCINNDNLAPVHFLHMLSSAAEVIGGMAKDPPRFDVPYTWNLIRRDRDGGNYQAWQSFAAYVAYNFRGTDTTGSRRDDDLLWRWARQSTRTLTSLAQRLSPAECAECTTRTYFNGLSPTDRFQLLLHNWRIAQFVNKPSLAQGQYGFPPQFKFDPMRDIGNWQNMDGSAADDTVNIPLELTLSTAHITREISQAGRAAPQTLANAHVVALERFGADYWVIRSDPSLWSANQDLVVRVVPEGICRSRIMVSAVTYSEQNLPGGQPDSLWKHPEWVQTVIGPVSRELDLAGGADERAELVVPGFGQTSKAVLVVVTLGNDFDDGSAIKALPYRLNMTLRTGTYQTPNPMAAHVEGTVDDFPAWSPAGDEVAFMRGASGLAQIYRKRLDGSPATPLISQPVDQFRPDWSPRGDWVAFDQEDAGGFCNVFVFNPSTLELRQLSSAPEHEFDPAFSPNGQRLAYVRTSSTIAEIHRVDLAGTNDTVLVRRFPAPQTPRWSPDGRWIYFTTGDSLYAVGAEGANRGNVLNKTALLAGATRFDLPLGNGRMVAERTWSPQGCSGGAVAPRVVAVDTAQVRHEALFYRSRATLANPRWSFDNTRVAYASDQNGTRDIFIGQVSYNHAPVFSNPALLADQQVILHQAFSLQISASDADGEAVALAP